MNGANFPAWGPSVFAVGGTTLSVSGGQYSEVVWNDVGRGGLFGGGNLGAGGSGCSGEFSRPAWQMGSGFAFGSCSKRASVDISAAAQFNPSGNGGGIAAYDVDDGGWNSVVGTSAASPLVAAIMVRLGLAGTDNHQLFYDHISDFNDVTSGGNDNDGLCNDVMCTAGNGVGRPHRAWHAERRAPRSRLRRSPPGVDAAAPPIDASVSLPIEAGPPRTSIASDSGSAEDSSTQDEDATTELGQRRRHCRMLGFLEIAHRTRTTRFLFARPAGCSCRSAPASPLEGGRGAGGVAAVVLALVIRRRGARAATRRIKERALRRG